MAAIFNEACVAAGCLQCTSLEHPVGRALEPTHELSVLPLKPIDGNTKLKVIVEKVLFEPKEGECLNTIADLVSNKCYQDLPKPLALKDALPMSFTLQLVFRKQNDTTYEVLKHYTFSQKIDIRMMQQVASGDLFFIDYGKNFRSGSQGFQYLLERVADYAVLAFQFTAKPKNKSKDKSALEQGFSYIQSEGPKSNMNNQWTEWAEIEVNREESPIYGWSTGLVKESLKGYATGNVFVQPTFNFYLTMHDLSAWFLEDVIFPLLPDMKNKTLVLLGNAGAGKTPAASAIAMAFSEYWLLRGGSAEDMQPNFRLASSFDQLRGEPGLRQRPDILDDADMSQQALPKLKAFLDSSLEEAYTVERWTTTKFVKNQLRILCDNRVNGKAEDKLKPGENTIPFSHFLDIIAPAFPEKAERQDIIACLKRAHFVVNLDYATYVRPAGIGEGPVTVVRYPEDENNRQITDFISADGKKVIANMKDGDNTTPTDWMSKRQWSHDLLTLCLESQKAIPRITVVQGAGLFGGEKVRKEIKPRLPSSGRLCVPPPSFLQAQEVRDGPSSSHSFAPTPHQVAKDLVKVKIEPGTFKALKRPPTKVIELDTPSPQPKKVHRRVASCLASDADGFPDIGDGEDGED